MKHSLDGCVLITHNHQSIIHPSVIHHQVQSEQNTSYPPSYTQTTLAHCQHNNFNHSRRRAHRALSKHQDQTHALPDPQTDSRGIPTTHPPEQHAAAMPSDPTNYVALQAMATGPEGRPQIATQAESLNDMFVFHTMSAQPSTSTALADGNRPVGKTHDDMNRRNTKVTAIAIGASLASRMDCQTCNTENADTF